MQAEKLFEEIEIVDNVKDEDALGRNCEERLENYVYFDIGQTFETIEKEPNDEANARNMKNYKNHVMVIHRQKAVSCAGLNKIHNSEL